MTVEKETLKADEKPLEKTNDRKPTTWYGGCQRVREM